ncbi:sterol desaturase family protein [Zavarzinia compransoris]|uniref:sterol desaturase family protein n=1 Tax=Zavarzinia marina TaxID=2911065 RepID=UPI001F2FF802|nr:sterol desaturase family protein [Zavarzinia marina]MCF4164499.1 sterol desaturase family protein [Zavarzinia marina]
METKDIAVFGIFLAVALLEACFTGLIAKKEQKPGDRRVEVLSLGAMMLISMPLALAGGAFLASQFAPRDALIGLPVIAQIAILLIFDDMFQYWWHRLSHSVSWLYKLHRPHHNAEYMSVRIVYRNNFFYYLLMPSLWLSGALIFLGLGHVYAIYVVVKMAVIIGAHSDLRWDAPLYRIKWLSPVMWVVERTISTPATHAAHHGKHASDGVTNYKGNFGNLLFFWDVLFGTAKITRRYPEQFGVENLPPTTVSEQMLWPLFRAPEETIEEEPVAVRARA